MSSVLLVASLAAASAVQDPTPFDHGSLTLGECESTKYQGPWNVNVGMKKQIKLGDWNMCMDNGPPFGTEGSVVSLYECQPDDDEELNQSWNYTFDGHIISLQEGNRCVSLREDGLVLYLSSRCYDRFGILQGSFYHEQTGLCVTAHDPGSPIPVPQLNIAPGKIYSVGGSSGGDFAVQFHMAFSEHVSGVCGYDAQPYYCAVTYFPDDFLLPLTERSPVPYCYGCPKGKTVLYDKCKNHPQSVDVGMLPDYPRHVCGEGGKPGCIDNVYLSRGECKTYIDGADVNTLSLYGMMTSDPGRQLKYIDKCKTPNVDDSLECIKHVVGNTAKQLMPPASYATSDVKILDIMPFLTNHNIGFESTAFAYIPRACYDTFNECQLLVSFHGCGGNRGVPQNSTLHAYAESNRIVVLYPRISKENNSSKTYPSSFEISRGCWDGYGQLSPNYALQSGEHMSTVWRIVKYLAGIN